MGDKRIAELEELLKAIQEELTQAKKQKAEEEWPKIGDTYYFVGQDGAVESHVWANDEIDKGLCENRNFFLTTQEAQSRADLLRWLAADPDRWEKIKIWREMVECADGFEPDWEDESEKKYEIECISGNVDCEEYGDIIEGTVYFRSPKHADRLKRYWFGVKE